MFPLQTELALNFQINFQKQNYWVQGCGHLNALDVDSSDCFLKIALTLRVFALRKQRWTFK